MSALPLIEAVQRAGGAIILQGDRLRLSAPEPLPENLLQELRAHKAEVIDHLQHARRPKLGAACNGRAHSRHDPVGRGRVLGRGRRPPGHHGAAPHLSGACLAAADHRRRAVPGGLGAAGGGARLAGLGAVRLPSPRALGPDRGHGAGAAAARRPARRPDRERGGDPAGPAARTRPGAASRAIRCSPPSAASSGSSANEC